MDKPFDVIIAGGGAAGVLAAARLAKARPEARILLLEREASLGGRLRSSSTEQRAHSQGLNTVSDTLLGVMRQTLLGATAEGGEANDGVTEAPELPSRRQTRMGVLAGNRMTQADIGLWFSPKGARTLGGLTAARQWGAVEEIVRAGASKALADDEDDDKEEDGEEAEGDDRSHAFSHYWKQTRKTPAAVVLEHFGNAFGVPDVWGATPEALAERAAFHSGHLHCARWDETLQHLTELESFKQAVTVKTSNRVLDAGREGDEWVVTAEQGIYRAKALIVAQPPWQAAGWLKRTNWPAHLLQVASKTKPVSVVVLSERLTNKDADIPDVIIVPSEKVQAIRSGVDEITFQATIDYELSLQAPAVVKAVKALKRARKKLNLLHPGLVTETNFVALQPVAWAQSPAHSDRRLVERLGKKSFNSATLAFCGDAYGASYNGDTNLVNSLQAAVEAVSPG